MLPSICSCDPNMNFLMITYIPASSFVCLKLFFFKHLSLVFDKQFFWLFSCFKVEGWKLGPLLITNYFKNKSYQNMTITKVALLFYILQWKKKLSFQWNKNRITSLAPICNSPKLNRNKQGLIFTFDITENLSRFIIESFKVTSVFLETLVFMLKSF